MIPEHIFPYQMLSWFHLCDEIHSVCVQLLSIHGCMKQMSQHMTSYDRLEKKTKKKG